MTQSNLKGIIFDFNGVMVNDYSLQKEAWDHISEIIRRRPVSDEEMIYRICGVPTRDTIAWMAAGTLSQKRLEELAKTKSAITKKLFADSPLLQLTPGLSDFLDELTQHDVARTIATSQTPEVFSHLFDQLHLERWFDKRLVVCNDGTHAGKPAPDAYIKAAKILHINPDECVVVEDARSGIQAAYEAGVRHIIAIGNDEQLKALRPLAGVVKTIHNFTGLQVSDLFASGLNGELRYPIRRNQDSLAGKPQASANT